MQVETQVIPPALPRPAAGGGRRLTGHGDRSKVVDPQEVPRLKETKEEDVFFLSLTFSLHYRPDSFISHHATVH